MNISLLIGHIHTEIAEKSIISQKIKKIVDDIASITEDQQN